jgi:hypothetical protein
MGAGSAFTPTKEEKMAKNGNGNSKTEQLPAATNIEPPKVADYAPPGHPDRATQIAKLTAEGIRSTCADTGKTIMHLVTDIEEQVAKIRQEAETFTHDLNRIGNNHADRIENVLGGLRDIMKAMLTERERVTTMMDVVTAVPNPAAMEAVQAALDTVDAALAKSS